MNGTNLAMLAGLLALLSFISNALALRNQSKGAVVRYDTIEGRLKACEEGRRRCEDDRRALEVSLERHKAETKGEIFGLRLLLDTQSKQIVDLLYRLAEKGGH